MIDFADPSDYAEVRDDEFLFPSKLAPLPLPAVLERLGYIMHELSVLIVAQMCVLERACACLLSTSTVGVFACASCQGSLESL